MKRWLFPSRSCLAALLASCVIADQPHAMTAMIDMPAGIDRGKAARFIEHLRDLLQAGGDNFDHYRVRLSGTGGYTLEALRIARVIHDLGFDTEATGECLLHNYRMSRVRTFRVSSRFNRLMTIGRVCAWRPRKHEGTVPKTTCRV